MECAQGMGVQRAHGGLAVTSRRLPPTDGARGVYLGRIDANLSAGFIL
ncbi:MAG: hypothetical protein ACK55I_26675 [bacterium]